MDIENRKLAEDGLRASEARHRTLLEALEDGVFVAQDRRFVFANPALSAMLGYALEEFTGLPFEAVIAPEHLTLWTERFAQRIAGGEPPLHYAVRLIPKSGGEPLDAELRARRIEYEGRPAVLGVLRDVTQRHRAEAALRAARDTFRHLVRNSPFGVYVVDADFRLTEVSAGAQNVFTNVRPLIGRDFAEVLRCIWPEPFASKTIGLFRHTLETGEPYHAPGTVERRQDTEAVESYDWKIERIALPDGRYGVVCHFYDLSERQRYEKELREREEFTRQITDVAPSILYVYDLDEQRNVWGNREMFSGLGYTREQLEALSGSLLTTLLHPDDQIPYALHRERLNTLADEEVAEFEYRLRRADGSWRWLYSGDMIFRRSEEGRPRQIVGAALDITERKQAEDALRQANQRLEESLALFDTFLTTTPVGIAFLDTEFRYVRINQTLAALNALPIEAHIGRPIADVLPHLWTLVEPYLRRVRETGEPLLNVEIRGVVPARGQQEGMWLASYYPVRVGSNLLGFGIVAQDVTDQKWYEAALREADRRKDEFLAMLAHELRNPLAPIRNAVQILRLTGPKEPTLDGARAMIERQVNHLVRLVDDLLDVSRISRGKIQLQKAPLDLAIVVQQAVETSRPLIDSRRHRLSVVLPPEPVRADGDFTRLTQVVSNLLNNAAKYTDEGGQISVTLEQTRQEDGQPPTAVIRVRDNGRGIDPPALNSLFELFYQVDRNLDRAEGGLGIGLSLVKSLVAMHGGEVEAYSAGRGKGSEFVIRLPCLEAAPTAAQRNVPDGQPQTAHRLRILVVDDNADSAESMAMLLEMLGHEVLIARDGEQAVAVALAERPDAVLLDIGLPKLDGHRACRAMREGGLHDTLIVAMTGYGQVEDRELSRAARFDAHLVKPVNFDALRAMLTSLGSN